MITSIEKIIGIKKDNKLIPEKIKLISKQGIIPKNIFATLDNKVININDNKIIYKGTNVILDNNIILDNVFDYVYKVYDINGNYLFEGRKVKPIGYNLFSKCIDKIDIFGKLSNKQVLCNDKGEIRSKKEYDELKNESCKRIIVIKNNKYGVIDRIGNTIVKPIYLSISNYDNGIAILKDYDGYSLININGHVITKEKYDLMVKINDYYMVAKNNKYGYINNSGEIIIPLIYDYIGEYSTNLIPIKNNNKYGFINAYNKLIINTIYDNICKVGNEYIGLIKKDNGVEKEQIINKEENIVSDLPEDTYIFNSSDNLLIANKLINENTLTGCIDLSGNTIIPFIYDNIRPFKQNIAIAKLNNKYGVIDKNNNIIVDFKYDEISNFYNGHAITKNNNLDKYGLIDSKGNTILPEVFNNIILLNDNKVYVEGYIYDIDNIEIDYKIIINNDDRIIIKSFNNEGEMNNYYNLFTEEYNNFMEKLGLTKNKKLIKNK